MWRVKATLTLMHSMSVQELGELKRQLAVATLADFVVAEDLIDQALRRNNVVYVDTAGNARMGLPN